MKAACFEGFASHADENLLIGGNIFRIEMPMTVGHAGFVEWKSLCIGNARATSKQQSSKKCLFMNASLDRRTLTDRKDSQ
jgi:hypothetical protein